ncbi:MAG: RNA polymerase sigma factor [Clostridia bacterium]|nr:RNA polymerase sigma factor [Clostridia bacterium]
MVAILFFTLLSALSDDDRDFIRDIYAEYGDYMYKVALDVLHSKQDAEDAVMDAMYKIIKYIAKFEGATDNEIRNQVVIGIRTTVKRKAIDHYNTRRNRFAAETDLYYTDADGEYAMLDPEDTSFDLDAIVIRAENQRAVQKALLRLSQELQDAVNLTYIGGYSCVEAADFLEISDGALRARLYKARKKLSEMLKEEFREHCEKR